MTLKGFTVTGGVGSGERIGVYVTPTGDNLTIEGVTFTGTTGVTSRAVLTELTGPSGSRAWS